MQTETEALRSEIVVLTVRVVALEQENADLRKQLYDLDIARTNDMLARRDENNKRRGKSEKVPLHEQALPFLQQPD